MVSKENEADLNDLQCASCKGLGLVPTEVLVCNGCAGKGCSGCGIRESGLDQTSWTECVACIGTGSKNVNVHRSVLGLPPHPPP